MTQMSENTHSNTTNYNPQAIETNFRFIEQIPSFWSTQFRDQVIERQPVDPEKLRSLQQQTVKYAMYRSHGSAGYGVEASASQLGWCKSISAAHNGQRLYNVNVLPNNIKLEITQAPSEFACPVKQDKRMLPDFKVKATLRYDKDQDGLYCPLTMKTEVISYEQYSQMCSWSPSTTKERLDSMNDSRKFQVPLKGTREIYHLFATENMRQGHRPPSQRFQFPPSLNYSNAGMGSHYDMGPTLGVDDLDYDLGMPMGRATAQYSGYQFGQAGTNYHKQDQYGDYYGQDMYDNYSNRAQSARAYGQGGSGYYGGSRAGSLTEHIYGTLVGAGAGGAPQHLPEQSGRSPVPYAQGGPPQLSMTQRGQPEKEELELSHEFVFTNLEFKKPSRMQKVYLVFYAMVENVDLLYILFKMPTVCICRAEQRFRACTLLGIPSYRKPKNYPSPLKLRGILQGWDEKISTIKSTQDAQLTQGQLWEMSVGLDHDKPSSSSSGQQPHQALQNPTVGVDSSLYTAQSMEMEQESDAPLLEVEDRQNGISGSMIWEYVREEYAKTGLQRELTPHDKKGIWIMSMCIDERGYVSEEQFQKFQADFQKVLKVLMKFSKYWNMDNDICYMTDWGLSSSEASNMLVDENPGSCILRLSQTLMGSISLTVALQQGNREQSVKEIRHFLVKYDQLMSLPTGSLDILFQKFGVEFIVDPYTKRKTPREKLVSNYTNWEDILEEVRNEEKVEVKQPESD
eukprot:TRINITY_DN5830_c0_g2_i1.p1 TRINITY_DN5830_c0_g2~~TRINITY_DN5830_c0_g2_i1.p1  ORF type:complete len:738 (+),score=53.32 TRINITY_DN5830_c0_g2_i1:91-2304(+)